MAAEFTASKVSRHVALTTSFQEIHAVDARRALRLNLIHLANVTAGVATVDVCYAPTGGAPGIGNAVIYGKQIAGNEYLTFMQDDIVRGASIQARASVDDTIVLKLAGEEESSI